MSHPGTLIPIHPVTTSDCGGCDDGSQGRACSSGFGLPCASPQLQGEAPQVQRAMAALRSVIDPDHGSNLVELQLVQSLRIADGEAELTVTFPRGCGVARLMAEDAFQVLRRALPDTDVYVRHAA